MFHMNSNLMRSSGVDLTRHQRVRLHSAQYPHGGVGIQPAADHPPAKIDRAVTPLSDGCMDLFVIPWDDPSADGLVDLGHIPRKQVLLYKDIRFSIFCDEQDAARVTVEAMNEIDPVCGACGPNEADDAPDKAISRGVDQHP